MIVIRYEDALEVPEGIVIEEDRTEKSKTESEEGDV